MSEMEVFDPTQHQHDARLKPSIALGVDPADYGETFYWVNFVDTATNRILSRQLFNSEEYAAVFDIVRD